jgi:hypothetical protein
MKTDREQLMDFLEWVKETFDGLLEIESPVQYTENGEVVAPKLWLHMDEWLKEADTGKLVNEYLASRVGK